MTADAAAGETLFASMSCATCHSGATFRDGLRHDVGTVGEMSGQRLGSTIDGIDTPTLLGLWNSAPYLHDGSAMTLDEVFQLSGGSVHQIEDGTLNGGADLKDNTQWPPIAGYLGSGVVEVREAAKA